MKSSNNDAKNCVNRTFAYKNEVCKNETTNCVQKVAIILNSNLKKDLCLLSKRYLDS